MKPGFSENWELTLSFIFPNLTHGFEKNDPNLALLKPGFGTHKNPVSIILI